MVIAAVEIKLYMPWVHSLKEKRMAVKSILQKTQHHFHVSVAEVDYQQVQQSAAIAFAVVTCTVGQANQVLQNIMDYVQEHTQAEITNIDRVIY